MSRTKKLIRLLIIAIPYLLFVVKVLFTVLDQMSQDGCNWLLTKLNLLEDKQEPKPII